MNYGAAAIHFIQFWLLLAANGAFLLAIDFRRIKELRDYYMTTCLMLVISFMIFGWIPAMQQIVGVVR